MKDVKETVTELKRQQALGKIRYYAVSNFGLETMKQFHENGGVATTNQVRSFKHICLTKSLQFLKFKISNKLNKTPKIQ